MAITSQSIYKQLSENDAINLAKQLGIFEENSPVSSREIGDGNLNLVFHLVDQSKKKSVIIKQALPYAKVVGESMPLTLKRATIESNALLTSGSYVPHLVPKVFYADEVLAVTVMEDLSHLQIARAGLIKGEEFPQLSEHIGTYMARTLFYTSDFGLSPSEKKKLVTTFINPELCKITEDLVFTDPFFDHVSNNYETDLQHDVEKLWYDSAVKLEVAKLKQKFLTQADALVHGDLHTGSIFANETETKVIDPEFAFFGPFGFDIGQFIANLLLNAISREEQSQEPLFSHISNTWNVYTSTFSELWHKEGLEPYTKLEGYLQFILAQTLEDAIGFAGCEVIRRTIGLAHVADLDGIQDYQKRIRAKQHALELGKSLIKNRAHITELSQIRAYFDQTGANRSELIS